MDSVRANDAEEEARVKEAQENPETTSEWEAEGNVTGSDAVGRIPVERVCLATLTLLAVFYTLYFARTILLPMTMAAMLSFVLKPIVKFFSRWGLPHILSATALFLAVTVAIGLGGLALYEPATEWLNRAPQTIREIGSKFNTDSARSPLGKIKEVKEEVDKMTSAESDGGSDLVRIEQPPLASQMLNTTGSFATSATITLLLLYFLLATGDRFAEKAVELMPTWEGKWEIALLFQQIQKKISAYLATISVINAGLGVVVGLGMWAIGLPNPLLWGVLAAVLNFIPFAGLVLGSITVFIVAASEFATLSHALTAPAIYLMANGLEANFVTPAVLGKSISLNPVVILLAIFMGGWIWGIGGIFLAVPILLVLKIVCDNYEGLRPFGVFLAR